MSRRMPPCEVVVIGLGAAGGLAAAILAREGVEVVGLEAGPRYRPEDFALDEIQALDRNHLGAAKVNGEIPTFRQGPDEEAKRTWPISLLMMNGVGGAKIHSTNISWRLNPWNFKMRSEATARYGSAAIPADSTMADWPFDYDELEPYYDAVEGHYSIAGADGANPFEGHRSRPYPSPPLRSSGWTRLMDEAANRLGWDPFPTPASIRTVPEGDKLPCQYCGQCTWNGCWVDAKAVPSSKGLPEAEATGNLTVVTGARVTELVVDRDGKAEGVRYVVDGEEVLQPAKLVIVAAYTYENSRLLLLSKSDAFPRGVGNTHDQVGRHFTTHTFLAGFGLFPGRKMNLWTGGGGAQATAVDNFNADNFDHASLSFVGGSVMMACHDFRPMLHHRLVPPSVARWGAERKRWIAENLGSVGWAYAIPDALPYEDDRLDLDPTVRDPYGVPVIRVTQGFRDNERLQYEFLADKLSEWMVEAGASETWNTPIANSPVSTHAYGGTRMGGDPETSVVDSYGFVHGVPNLVVLGASCFPGGGGVNPTETVEAVTWRSADKILAALGGGPSIKP